ncbi:MAG TPA: hypothetical protein VMG11_02945 [Steroidobacteraceae bacterium]|nr:hypothetical protein [Steroidobacteraceae bacterium]
MIVEDHDTSLMLACSACGRLGTRAMEAEARASEIEQAPHPPGLLKIASRSEWPRVQVPGNGRRPP